MGLVAVVRPDFDISPRIKLLSGSQRQAGAALIFGFHFFTDWFPDTFAAH